MVKKLESKKLRLINDRRSLKESAKEDYSAEISYWENVLLDLERRGDWDSDEHEEAQSRLNHYRNLQYEDNFYVEDYSSGNGLSASANEIYNYIKNVYGFGNITPDSAAPLIAFRQLIKKAVAQYIKDYGNKSQTIEDYLTDTEFHLLANILVGDLMEQSSLKESAGTLDEKFYEKVCRSYIDTSRLEWVTTNPENNSVVHGYFEDDDTAEKWGFGSDVTPENFKDAAYEGYSEEEIEDGIADWYEYETWEDFYEDYIEDELKVDLYDSGTYDSNDNWDFYLSEDDLIKLGLLDKKDLEEDVSYNEYSAYDKNEWEQSDIDLHKSIDWAERNYAEIPIESESFSGEVTLYGDGDPIKKEVRFVKYLRSNPIYPPYYAADDDRPFDVDVSYVGPMYDGNSKGKYGIHDRYETSSLYSVLSDSVIRNPKSQDTLKEYVDRYGNWTYESDTLQDKKCEMDILADAILATGYKPQTSIENLCEMIYLHYYDELSDLDLFDKKNVDDILDNVALQGGFREFDYTV